MTTRSGTAWTSDDFRWLGGIVSLGVVLRVAALLLVPHVPESDELAYRTMALNLLHGHGIVDNMGNRAMYNVGYPLFVLAPLFSLFGEADRIARAANVFLGSVSIALCYAIAVEAGGGRIARRLAGLGWALYLPASVYCVYVAKENLMIPLMLATLWIALRLEHTGCWRQAALCGFLIGLLALVGNAALSLIPAVAYTVYKAPRSTHHRASLLLYVVLIAFGVCTPWMIRNASVLGEPVLNTNGGFNLYIGNNPGANGLFVSIDETPRAETWEALRKTGEVQASDTLRREAVSWIREHPAKFLLLACRKALLFWLPPMHHGAEGGSFGERIMRAAWAVEFCGLLVAAVAGVVMSRARARAPAMLWIALASYTSVHMLFYVVYRYREPVMPIVVLLAALSIEAAVRMWAAPGARVGPLGGWARSM